MKRQWIIALYILVLHFIVIDLLRKEPIIWQLAQASGILNQSSLMEQHYQTRLQLYFQRQDQQLTKPYDMFIGASLMQGFANNTVSQNSVNFSIGGDTIDNLIKRIATYQSLNRVKTLVVQIGGNDLKTLEVHEIASRFSELTHYFETVNRVLWLAVLPYDLKFQPHRDNQAVKRLNAKIREYCAKLNRCHFIAADATLIDEQGQLLTGYHLGDGIHLNDKGYGIWRQQLMPWFTEENESIDELFINNR